MSMLQHGDIVADIRLFHTGDGGRRGATPTQTWSCPLVVNGQYYDSRLILDDVGALMPGQQARISITFLDPAATVHFRPGTVFAIWEGRVIGEGRVVEADQQ
jgi:hypothetical protein